MLRKPKTITSNARHPKTLKPQRARQLIRRFHTLQKWKGAILRQLKHQNPEITDENYPQLLGAEYSAFQRQWQLPEGKRKGSDGAKTVGEVKIDLDMLRAKLIETLAGIDHEVEQRGGLHVYQMASTVGQAGARGGDLLKWLVGCIQEMQIQNIQRTLEIGSLSVDNLILRSGTCGTVCRIDLHSQHPQILQQDFMQRPLPRSDADRFNLVSCLLVLNFVPDAGQRFLMLRRITDFLLPSGLFFLVLPRPCVDNSRYMDMELLASITQSLGFRQLKSHLSTKLCYVLYEWTEKPVPLTHRKKELRAGKSRNNFYIDPSRAAE